MITMMINTVSNFLSEIVTHFPVAAAAILQLIIASIILWCIPIVRNVVNKVFGFYIKNSDIVKNALDNEINKHDQIATKDDLGNLTKSIETLSREIRVVNKKSHENVKELERTFTNHSKALNELITLTKSISEELKDNSVGTKGLIRDKLNHCIGVALKRGVTTEREYFIITELYNSYVKLGGNGEIAMMYEKYRELDRVSEYDLAKIMILNERK